MKAEQVLSRTTSKPIDLYRLTKRMMAVFAQNARQARRENDKTKNVSSLIFIESYDFIL